MTRIVYPRPCITDALFSVDKLMLRSLNEAMTRIGAGVAQGRNPTLVDRLVHVVAGGHLKGCLEYWRSSNQLQVAHVTYAQYTMWQVGLRMHRAEPLARVLLDHLYGLRRTLRVKEVAYMFDFTEQFLDKETLVLAQEAVLCDRCIVTPPILDFRAEALMTLLWTFVLGELYRESHVVLTETQEERLKRRKVRRGAVTSLAA